MQVNKKASSGQTTSLCCTAVHHVHFDYNRTKGEKQMTVEIDMITLLAFIAVIIAITIVSTIHIERMTNENE